MATPKPLYGLMAEFADPTALVGFSDVTALHQAVVTRLGVSTLHGPMSATQSFVGSHAAQLHLRATLLDPESVQVLSAPTAHAVLGGRAHPGSTVTIDEHPAPLHVWRRWSTGEQLDHRLPRLIAHGNCRFAWLLDATTATTLRLRIHDASRRYVPRRFAVDAELREVVAGKLVKHWSPAQISRWLRRRYHRRSGWHVCTETIYEAVYRGLVVPVDRQNLRTGRTYRRRRGRGAVRAGGRRGSGRLAARRGDPVRGLIDADP